MNYNKPKVFVAACFGMAFFGVAFIVIGSILPSLSTKYSLSAVESSGLVSLLPVGILFGSVAFGIIVDRYGYKMLLVSSTLFLILGIEGISLTENINFLRLYIYFIGLGGGMLNGATNALTSDVSDDRERGAKLSILGVCYSVGALGIPLLLGFLSHLYTSDNILRWTGILMVVPVVYFIIIQFPEPKFKQGFPIKEALKLVREPLLLILSFFLFFQSGMEGLINNWTTTYLNAKSFFEGENIVFGLSFFILGITIARLALSYFLRYGRYELILIFCMAVAAIGMAILHFAVTLSIVFIGLFVCGLGLAAGFPIIISYIGTQYKNISGTAIGFAMVVALCGNTLLNYGMGYISRSFGISSFPFLVVILLLVQAVIIVSNLKSIEKIY